MWGSGERANSAYWLLDSLSAEALAKVDGSWLLIY
jgi:hypothetical protein